MNALTSRAQARMTGQTMSYVAPPSTKAETAPQPDSTPKDCCEVSFGARVANTGAWTVAGAAAGVATTFMIASQVQGPSALGALVLIPFLGAAGAVGGGVVGWKIMG